MIQPVYFPFTHMSKSDIRLVSSFFKSIVFFPVSTKAEFENETEYSQNSDFISPLYVDDELFGRVLKKVDEYRAWGELNKDNKGNLKAFLKEQPYLTDLSGITSIRSGIKGKGKTPETASQQDESIIKDLMFLRLAKIHDMDKEKLADNLLNISKGEQKLFSEIRGLNVEKDGENIIKGNEVAEDLGAYMTSVRIDAWTGCFQNIELSSSIDSSLLFVTTSSAVMENLLSVSKNKIKLLDIDNLKVHENTCGNKKQQAEMSHKFIDDLVKSGEQASGMPVEADDNCTLTAKIKLYLLQGDDISSFFKGIGKNIPVCFISV